ncbi:Rv1355c family protein [bacterium]|jgi:molybdopterin/thiamine biosynthesis adenylyltransferase|nr:Rv1355c family protein [bacterium]
MEKYKFQVDILDPNNPIDADKLVHLKNNSNIQIFDEIESQLLEYTKLFIPNEKSDKVIENAKKQYFDTGNKNNIGVWVYYPWNNHLVHLLDENKFIKLRTARNMYKISEEEQIELKAKKIGVVGLSVGHAIALTIAQERICGEIRLADFDSIELSNLNRIRTNVKNIGMNKAILTAREILEIDPFLKLTIFDKGLNTQNYSEFLTETAQLDLVIEECDCFETKIEIRKKCKNLNIPVIMHTTDRELLDIERFDLEPDRPLFHGLTNLENKTNLKNLTNEEKIPLVLDILGINDASDRLKSSMLEIEQSINSWPQLASSVSNGAGIATHVARRILLSTHTQSGRYYFDLDEELDKNQPTSTKTESNNLNKSQESITTNKELVKDISANEYEFSCAKKIIIDKNLSATVPIIKSKISECIDCANQAPSGGNIQPWKWIIHNDLVFLFIDKSRAGIFLDINYLASHLALGAAAENFKIAAEKNGMTFETIYPDSFPCVAIFKQTKKLELTTTMPDLFNEIFKRKTNRKKASKQEIKTSTFSKLTTACESIEGTKVIFKTDPSDIAELSDIFAESEKCRFFHKQCHEEMYNEIRWNKKEVDDSRDGIDIDTLYLSNLDLAGLKLSKSWSVVELLKKVKGGKGIESFSLKQIEKSPAIGCIITDKNDPLSFFHGGQALEKLWLTASKEGLSLQPMTSICYLLTRLYLKPETLPAWLKKDLLSLKNKFTPIIPHSSDNGLVLLFRLFYSDQEPIASLKRPVEKVSQFL